jgi:hypothetical protein
VQGDWERTKNLLLGLVNAMPDDKWSFKPTPAQQTFAERAMHVAQIDMALLRHARRQDAGADDRPNPRPHEGGSGAALQTSFDYGAAVLQGVHRPAAHRAHRVDAVPRPVGVAAQGDLLLDAAHERHLRSARRVLRLNGVTPPASNRAEDRREPCVAILVRAC